MVSGLRQRKSLYFVLAALVPLGAAVLMAMTATGVISIFSTNPGATVPDVTVSTCDRQGVTPGAEADRILEEQDANSYAAARRVYEQVIDDVPGDNCATLGLRTLRALEDAQAASERRGLQYWAYSWESSTKRYLVPLGTLAAAAAAAVILLLIVARLLTPVMVKPATKAPLKFRRPVWVVGSLLVLTACLLAIATLSVGDLPDISVTVLLIAVGAAIAMHIGLAFIHRYEELRKRSWRQVVVVSIAATVAVPLALLAYKFPIWGQIPLTVTYLICSIALAVLGVAWVAFARGTKLAIQVQAAGGSDPGVAQLVLARLSDLGSERPRGIRTAEQSDISELPVDALTDVPTGALATALFNILRVIRPGVPWKVNLVLHGNESASWTVTRNGIPTRDGHTTISREQLLVEASEKRLPSDVVKPATATADEFAAACASDTLFTLSRAHQELTIGINGVQRWQSLAFHAIAVRSTTSEERRARLLQAAMLESRSYPLPRLALVNDMCWKSPQCRATYINELEELYKEIFPYEEPSGVTGKLLPEHGRPTPLSRSTVDEGMEPTLLRMLFSLAAGHFNCWLDALAPDLFVPADHADPETYPKAEWSRSGEAVVELTKQIDALIDPKASRRVRDGLVDLAGDFRIPVTYLRLELLNRGNTAPQDPGGDTEVHGRADDKRRKEPDQEVEDVLNSLLQSPTAAASLTEKHKETLPHWREQKPNRKEKAKKTGRSAERAEQRPEGVGQRIESKQQESQRLRPVTEPADVWQPRDLYARACYRARRAGAEGSQLWLNDLREAVVGDDHRRRWAQYDPSFAAFQKPSAKDNDVQYEYKRIVGDPPPTKYTELDTFKRYATDLDAAGVYDLDHLASLSADWLARRLKIDKGLVRRWQNFARLANDTKDEDGEVKLAVLHLLESVNIRTRGDLRCRMADSEPFYSDLVEAASGMDIVPSRAATVEKWPAGFFFRDRNLPGFRYGRRRPPSRHCPHHQVAGMLGSTSPGLLQQVDPEHNPRTTDLATVRQGRLSTGGWMTTTSRLA